MMRYAVAVAVFVAVLVVGGLVFLALAPASPPVEKVEKVIAADQLPQ